MIRSLQCLLAAAVVSIAPCVAQATKAERRVHRRSFELRAELVDAWRAADAAHRRAAAEAARGITRAEFLTSYVEAILAARGEEFDAAARLCSRLYPVVGPEVVDRAQFKDVFVTMVLARKCEAVGELRFVCTLRDADGNTVGDTVIDSETGIEQLLRARAAGPIDVGELDEGRYSVEVVPWIDGEALSRSPFVWRSSVWIHERYRTRVDAHPLFYTPFHPDYAAQVERAMSIVASVQPKLRTDAARAAYVAAVKRVDRAFQGEPAPVTGDALADIDALEALLERIEDEGGPYDGLTGRRTVGLPIPGDDQGELLLTPHIQASIDFPADGAAPKPLVVFLPGMPTWNGGSDRPISKFSEPPEWTVAELGRAGFDADGAFHVVVLESPGRVKSPQTALVAATRQLLELLPVRDRQVYWVGDRESAYVISRALLAEPGLARGAALVNGGAFSNAELEKVQDVDLLFVPSHGHASASFLEGLVKRAGPRGRVELLGGADERPWPLALVLAAEAIEAAAKACFARE